MDLTDHGWSGFTLNIASGRKLVFDPSWTNPFGTAHAARAAFADARSVAGDPGPRRSHPGCCRPHEDLAHGATDRMQELEMSRSLSGVRGGGPGRRAGGGGRDGRAWAPPHAV